MEMDAILVIVLWIDSARMQELWMCVGLRGFCIGAAYGPLLLIHSVVCRYFTKRGQAHRSVACARLRPVGAADWCVKLWHTMYQVYSVVVALPKFNEPHGFVTFGSAWILCGLLNGVSVLMKLIKLKLI